jgi:hypothetical protein
MKLPKSERSVAMVGSDVEGSLPRLGDEPCKFCFDAREASVKSTGWFEDGLPMTVIELAMSAILPMVEAARPVPLLKASAATESDHVHRQAELHLYNWVTLCGHSQLPSLPML